VITARREDVCLPRDGNQVAPKHLFQEARRSVASEHRLNLRREPHTGSGAGSSADLRRLLQTGPPWAGGRAVVKQGQQISHL